MERGGGRYAGSRSWRRAEVVVKPPPEGIEGEERLGAVAAGGQGLHQQARAALAVVGRPQAAPALSAGKNRARRHSPGVGIDDHAS